MVQIDTYYNIKKEVDESHAKLIVVTKKKTIQDIYTLYKLGQRDMGENYVQELYSKKKELPQDIRWHFLGHLQKNKVKQLLPFINMIHSIDSFALLDEVQKQASKLNKPIACLFQINMEKEETKFGISAEELLNWIKNAKWDNYSHIFFKGLMQIGTHHVSEDITRSEFKFLAHLLRNIQSMITNNRLPRMFFNDLSMGMSNDYKIALQEKSTMVRIGSLIMGGRI